MTSHLDDFCKVALLRDKSKLNEFLCNKTRSKWINNIKTNIYAFKYLISGYSILPDAVFPDAENLISFLEADDNQEESEHIKQPYKYLKPAEFVGENEPTQTQNNSSEKQIAEFEWALKTQLQKSADIMDNLDCACIAIASHLSLCIYLNDMSMLFALVDGFDIPMVPSSLDCYCKLGSPKCSKPWTRTYSNTFNIQPRLRPYLTDWIDMEAYIELYLMHYSMPKKEILHLLFSIFGKKITYVIFPYLVYPCKTSLMKKFDIMMRRE